MAKADEVWVTLTEIHVRSAEEFYEEVEWWDPVYEPGNSAQWDLVASGAMTWDGKFDVRGDDEQDVEDGKHEIPPRNPVIQIHETQETDLSKHTPPELRVSGTEDDDLSGDESIPEIVVDLGLLRHGKKAYGTVNAGEFHYVVNVVVQPSQVGMLGDAPELPSAGQTTDDPAMVFTSRRYPQTREREPVARGDGARSEGQIVWNHRGPKVPAADREVRVFDLQHRTLETFEAARGGVGACPGATSDDPALYVFRPRSRPNLVALLRDGDPAPIYLALPETRVPSHPAPSRPSIAQNGKEISIAFADPGAERLLVYRLDYFDGLAAQADANGLVQQAFVDVFEIQDTCDVAPAVGYAGDSRFLAWSSGAAGGIPGELRVKEIDGVLDRQVQVSGVPAKSALAPAMSVFESNRVTIAWTDPSGQVTIQDVASPAPPFGVTLSTSKAGSAPALASDGGRLYVTYAILDEPHFLRYELVTTFNRTGRLSASASATNK